MRPLRFTLALLAGTSLLLGQARDQTHVGQYSEAEILRGSQIYANTCAVCHGLTGNALVAVDLARNRFRNAVIDDDLRRVVRSGIPGLGMPSFSLADADLSAVIAFIRSGLGTRSPVPAARIGNADRGRTLFEGKGGCLSCHRVGEKGSRVAPDLTNAGSSRTAAALYLSLIDPTSAMLPINRPIRAVTNDGQTISGRRLNEDTYTVLLIDEKERLVALEKSTLREFQILMKSTMPSYRDKLTADEIADVLGYLLSLTDAPQTGRGGRGNR
jgi:putative heme-binding domain-containing protein